MPTAIASLKSRFPIRILGTSLMIDITPRIVRLLLLSTQGRQPNLFIRPRRELVAFSREMIIGGSLAGHLANSVPPPLSLTPTTPKRSRNCDIIMTQG